MEETKDVILFTYDFFENTTSANRFRVLVDHLVKRSDINVRVIEFQLKERSNTVSCEIGNIDKLEESISKHVKIFQPKIGTLQKLVLRSESKSLNFVYQLLFREETLTPRDLSLIETLNKNNKDGYIITSGAPYGIFKYAHKLARHLNFKLVLDYRDPWTYGYQNLQGIKSAYKLKRAILRNTEKSLLRKASLITTVSETLKSYFPSEFQHKIHVIPNGSNYGEPDIMEKQDRTFNIVYTGTVYNDQLKDNAFFLALRDFVSNKSRETIKLQFLGSFYSPLLKDKVEEFGLSEITTITKRLRKYELLPYLNNANLFLHLKYSDRSGIITSKQADYLFFRKPILLPSSDNGDLEKSILHNNAGFVCNSKQEVIHVLEDLYGRFQNGETTDIQQSEDMLKENSRQAIAKRFVDLVLNS